MILNIWHMTDMEYTVTGSHFHSKESQCSLLTVKRMSGGTIFGESMTESALLQSVGKLDTCTRAHIRTPYAHTHAGACYLCCSDPFWFQSSARKTAEPPRQKILKASLLALRRDSHWLRHRNVQTELNVFTKMSTFTLQSAPFRDAPCWEGHQIQGDLHYLCHYTHGSPTLHAVFLSARGNCFLDWDLD